METAEPRRLQLARKVRRPLVLAGPLDEDRAYFHDQVEPLGPVELGALAAAPDIDRQLMQELWLGSTEGAPKKRMDCGPMALATEAAS